MICIRRGKKGDARSGKVFWGMVGGGGIEGDTAGGDKKTKHVVSKASGIYK